jgi:hypothetical protein
VVRGYSEDYFDNVFGVDVSSLLWHDTKTVRHLSTYVSTNKFASKNYSEQPQKALGGIKTQKHYEIECPHIIREYHRHMGSVDLMDGL